MKAAVNNDRTHNLSDEAFWVSRLRENLTSGSYGEGLETGRTSVQVPRQSFTRQLLFKEWKSHANLRAFDTANPNIVEGLIWASLCAATLTRYCAHMTQRITRLAISTRRTAKLLHHVLPDVLYDLMHKPRRLLDSVERVIDYLAANAQRAHPKRDRKTGRQKLGLTHVYASA